MSIVCSLTSQSGNHRSSAGIRPHDKEISRGEGKTHVRTKTPTEGATSPHKATMTARFELLPSVGLSDISECTCLSSRRRLTVEELGTSLYHLLQQLSSYQQKFIFPDDHTFYFLLLTQLDIRLIIESKQQLLIAIEILDLTRVSLIYQKHVLKDYKFQTVYDHYFGPTYPGVCDDGVYILDYPGVSFRFNLESDVYPEDDALKQVVELNPKVSALVIHQWDKWSQLAQNGFYDGAVKRCAVDDIEVESIHVDDANEHISLQITFFKHPSLKEYTLVIDRSLQQDILAELGPPDEIFLKSDSRSLIHGKQSDAATHVFHNYFRYGFDLLYTMTRSGGILTKVVLHANLPNSVMFGKYRKCCWTSKFLLSSESLLLQCKKGEQVVINRSDMLNQMELLDGERKNENEVDWGKSVIVTSGRYVPEFVHGVVNSVTLF